MSGLYFYVSFINAILLAKDCKLYECLKFYLLCFVWCFCMFCACVCVCLFFLRGLRGYAMSAKRVPYPVRCMYLTN